KTSWTALRRAAGLPGFRMYDLRHHAITALLENPDVSEQTVEDIAGHVNPKMKKRYSHIRMEYKRAAVDAILGKPLKKQPHREVRTKKSTSGTPRANQRTEVVQELAAVLAKLLNSA